MVDNCTIIKYQDAWNFKRVPARPVDLRIDYCGGMKFNDNFDWNNLWYDAVQVNNNTMVLLIGPPLYATAQWLASNARFQDPQGNILQFKTIELDRVCYTALPVNGYIDWIELITNNTHSRINVNRNNGLLNNKSVMVTLQKNNPVSWIQQWIKYHKDTLDVDAFLIYDNASTIYNTKQLEKSLKDLGVVVTVVNWPFPYGPQGSDFAPWDSDYGQYVMLEHAKIRYLNQASIVLNNDIDELIVPKGITLKDITEFLKNNSVQCLRYRGVWIEPYDIVNSQSADQIPFDQRHVKNYYCSDPNNKIGIGYKWMLVPGKVNLNQQWLVHHINGQSIENDQLQYCHYLSHNTNWSWRRDQYSGDPKNLIPNTGLLHNLKKME